MGTRKGARAGGSGTHRYQPDSDPPGCVKQEQLLEPHTDTDTHGQPAALTALCSKATAQFHGDARPWLSPILQVLSQASLQLLELPDPFEFQVHHQQNL